MEEINCHHNDTEREHHYGRDVWLSRKGAVNAEAGRPGLIPGSMGTASYVVVGRGNPVSLSSAPTAPAGSWEIPSAYKDIDRVMADAADLVEVRHVLRQLVNVKGD